MKAVGKAPWKGLWTLLPACLLVGCGAFDAAARMDSRIADGQRLLLEGRPLESREAFSALLRTAPDRIDVLHGYARASAQLHLYEEALPAYEKALRLSVRDGQLWEEHISALASAARIRRDPAKLETAFEKAAAGLFLFPDRIRIYENLGLAAEELKARGDYLKLLSGLHEKLPVNPILNAKLTQLRLEIARDHDLREKVAELTEQVEEDLNRIESSPQGLSALPPDRLYRLFSGYLALGQRGRAEALLPSLERSFEGLRLTRTERRRRIEAMIANTADSAERLSIIHQALIDFRPQWRFDNSDYWRLMEVKFEILVRQTRERRRRGEPPQEATAADLLQTGKSLSTADTSNGALWHLRTSRALIDRGVRLEDAISFAEQGVDRLRRGEPGLLTPSRSEVESATARQRLIADLELIQAEANLRAGHWAASESLLRTLLEYRPTAIAHAMLARVLKAQEKPEEAYPEFVAALAEGFAEDQSDWLTSTRRLAEETAAAMGQGNRLAADIARRRRQLKQNEEIRIVSERLDQPTPDFELIDTDGKTWSSSGLRGSVVLLNFWATWCAPCLREFPSFSKLIKSYAKNPDVVFLAVSIDESTAEIQSFLAENGYSFTAVYDNGAAADFQVEQIPATILIDRQGRIQYRTVGFPGEKQYMREMKLRIDALFQE